MPTIDPARQRAARRAIGMAFGVEVIDAVSALQGGGSTAALFKLTIDSQTYVLRLMGMDQSLQDRCIQIECARYGGALNLAPKCHYADAEQGIVIMDYIESTPVDKAVVLQQMPGLLKKLHYSAQMPPPFYPVFPYLLDLIDEVAALTPSQQLIDYFKVLKEVITQLQAHRQLASCHNDLNSENILYDGQRLYLIDFEAAGFDDPYFDLATVCQQYRLTTAEETAFLSRYLEREPTETERAKLCLMKQVSYGYQAAHFFQHAYQAGVMTYNAPIPSFTAWWQGKNAGQYTLTTAEDCLLYGSVLLQQSCTEMTTPAFTAAKKILCAN